MYLLSWVTALSTDNNAAAIVQAFSKLIDMQSVGLDTLK